MLALNFVLPFGNFMAYFCPRHEGSDPFVGGKIDELLRHLVIAGDQGFCDRRLKVIPRCVEGPWAVRQVVGSRPAILGKTLATKVTIGEGYCEVAMDVSMSKTWRPPLEFISLIKPTREFAGIEGFHSKRKHETLQAPVETSH